MSAKGDSKVTKHAGYNPAPKEPAQPPKKPPPAPPKKE